MTNKQDNQLLPLLAAAAALAFAHPGVALAGVRVWGLSGNSSTTTRTYQPQSQFLTGQPGPGAGALISQQSSGANGFQGGFLFRSASQQSRVMGTAGAFTLSGGLDDAQAGPATPFVHARAWVGVSDLFAPASPVRLSVGAAIGGNLSRARATPAIAVAFESARLTYRQSPWSIPGEAAPRDILGHLYFRGTGPVHGFGSLTIGALVPDTQASASDGYVVAVRTPRFHGFGARLTYVTGFQGVTAQGPFNPARPWDSYSAGESVDVSYQVRQGVSVGVYLGVTHNTAGSATTRVITETSARSRLVGLTIADHF